MSTSPLTSPELDCRVICFKITYKFMEAVKLAEYSDFAMTGFDQKESELRSLRLN